MSTLDLRPLSIGELLDRTFSLYRRNFLLFVGISAIPHLFVLAVKLAQVSVMPVATGPGRFPQASDSLVGSPGISGSFAAYGAIALLGVFVYLGALLFSQGGTVFAVSELYLGRETTIGQSFSRTKGEVGTLFGVLFLNGLVLLISFLLLIIPGIYMMCRLCVAVPAALLENLGPREALERSFALTKDNAGRSFLIYLLYFAILYAAVLLFAVPFGIGIAFSHNDPTMVRTWSALTEVGSFVAEVLIAPILTIAMAIFYFDLRVRKEAFDIQMMMHPLFGGVPAPRNPATLLS
ncbi:MAG TPA: hypothetical protein VGI46_20250 [Candidatus Acidoferrum sp.]|jgi:uncharacterized membrane protein